MLQMKALEKSLKTNELNVSDFAQNAKMVSVIDTETHATVTYPTVRSAAEHLGTTTAMVRKCSRNSKILRSRYIINYW